MKKLFLALILINLWIPFANASAPTPFTVFATILTDSGLGSATHIKLSSGPLGHDYHLNFQLGQDTVNCRAVYFPAIETFKGEYYVSAWISQCRSVDGSAFRLSNGSSFGNGTLVYFERIFTNSNTSFRRLTPREWEAIQALAHRNPEPAG